MSRRLRLAPLACTGITAAAAVVAGLWRLGTPVPGGAAIAELHAPLMVCGALGALIGIERAVAWSWPGFWLTPILCICGSVLAVYGLAPQAALVYAAAAALFAGGCLVQAVQDPEAASIGAVAAAAAWVAGCLQWWQSGSPQDAASWWLTFLILTVLAERIGMSRIMQPVSGYRLFGLGCAVLLASCAMGWFGAGRLVAGIALAIVAAATLRHDIARWNIRRAGAVRFYAACMLAGYGWLFLAAVLMLSGLWLDAAIHAVTIGFVLSMIFGHAPIILPGVLGIRVRFGPALYAPLALIQLAVVARVAGSGAEVEWLRAASGHLTVCALLGYAACLIWTSRPARKLAPGTRVLQEPR